MIATDDDSTSAVETMLDLKLQYPPVTSFLLNQDRPWENWNEFIESMYHGIKVVKSELF